MSALQTQAIVLSIISLTTVVAGKFVESFAVVDADNNLVGSKSHKTKEEATVELGSLKFYAEGLTFARATAKEGTTDKALVGKANIIAAYLMYKEQEANPVELVAEEAAVEEEVEVASTAEEF